MRTIEALEAERVTRTRDRPQRRALPATAAVRIAIGQASREDVVSTRCRSVRPQAQRLGIEVHAWIEELHRGLIGLAEEDALDEASLPPDRATVAELKANFASSGFEGRAPFELPGGEPATELPFTLKVGDDLLVRGRIDAVYRRTTARSRSSTSRPGAVPDEPDWGQLELYAEALAALGLVDGGGEADVRVPAGRRPGAVPPLHAARSGLAERRARRRAA